MDSREENFFHLGHGYFVSLIDAFLADKRKVKIFICSANNNFQNIDKERYGRYHTILKQTMDKWRGCFGGQVEIVDIGQFLRSDSFGNNLFEEKISAYLRQIEKRFNNVLNKRDSYEKLYTELEEWRSLGKRIKESRQVIEACLDIHPTDVHRMHITQDEMNAMAYILVKKPKWYSQDWIIQFMEFFNDIMNQSGELNNIVIIESKRNAYTWLGMSYLSKKMGRKFLKMLFFNNIPDLSGGNYMKSSKKDLCVSLNNFSTLDEEAFSSAFIEKMAQIFQKDKDNVIEEVKNLMRDCEKRFS